MAQRVVIPRMGQTMTEGLIAKWHKADGDAVQPGDDIYELEYDKATSVVQARAGGILKLLYKEGSIVPLGEAVAVILEGGEAYDPSMAKGAHSVANAAQGGAAEAPDMEADGLEAGSPDGAEAGFPDGEKPLVVATPLVRSLARQRGIDIRELARDGKRVTKQDLEAYLAKQEPRPAAQDAVQEEGEEGEEGGIRVSPHARKIAAEHGIDIAAIVPKDGKRITRDDVLSYYVLQPAPPREEAPPEEAALEAPLEEAAREEAPLEEAALEAPLEEAALEGPPLEESTLKEAPLEKAALEEPLPERPSREGPSLEARRVPMKGMRKAIAANMAKSYFTCPVVTLTTDADMGALLKMREEWNEEFASGGAKVTVTDMLIKAVAKALLEHGIVNTSLDGNEIVYHDEVNISVAVALKDGLVVPVVRDADKLGLRGIAEETRRLVGLAHSGRLRASDMSGGTFTVTNLGTFGIDAFTPIINYPQSAILGVGRTVKKPAVEGDSIVIQQRAALSFTHDHRVIDGAPGALFLQSVVRYIEKPFLLLTD